MVFLKKGDALPVLDIFLVSERGRTPIDLTDLPKENIVFALIKFETAQEVARRAVTGVVDAPGGNVQVYLQASDVANIGVYFMEISVTFLSGRELTFPTKGYETVEILYSL